MLLGRVVDNVWSTRKDESLTGMKFMIVRIIDGTNEESGGSLMVAVDQVGAGIGEKVLITRGSAARRVDSLRDAPVDAVIVGIIDEDKQDD